MTVTAAGGGAVGPYSGSGALTFDNNVIYTGNLTVQGSFTFGDAATDNLAVTGTFAQTGNGTVDVHTVVGSGALAAANDLVRFRSTGSISATSNVLAVEQATGAGVAGAYALYVSATGANVEGLIVDDGTSQFDELATFSAGINTAGITIPSGTTTFRQTSTGTAADVFGVAHSGDLTAGNDVVSIADTGSPSATSYTLNVVQSTGAGAAGAYALHISATGANVEGLHVDDGLAQFDETATFSGATAIDVNGRANLGGLVVTDQTAQTLAGAGAVDVTSTITHVETTGANALTLADGVQGQHKFILMTVDAGDGTLTPTNLAGAATTITFNDVGDAVHLLFSGATWFIVGQNGVLVA